MLKGVGQKCFKLCFGEAVAKISKSKGNGEKIYFFA